MSKGRIFSAMQPSGKFHLGNYMGALENWVKLQDEYDCIFAIADLHALTSAYADTSKLPGYIHDMMLDWLSAGLDPEKNIIFVQSQVKEHAELHLLLSMMTPLSWLERVPTYKDKLQNLGEQGKDINTYGFLGYPELMTADIVLYKAGWVPVGEDQNPHLELAREIVRRFNLMYGKEVFVEPQGLMSRAAVLPGIDGRKMSKSYGNTIPFAASPDELRELEGVRQNLGGTLEHFVVGLLADLDEVAVDLRQKIGIAVGRADRLELRLQITERQGQNGGVADLLFDLIEYGVEVI